MKIVADSAIPFLQGVLEPWAEVRYLPGSRIAVTGGCKLAGTEKHKVYAASENESSSLYSEDADYDLPSGIAGVVSGVNATPAAGSTVNRIGISCDDVIVGQRVRKVTSSAVEMNVSESMATTVDTFDAKVVSASSSAKLMSDEDRKSTRLNSSHKVQSRMPSSA